MADNTVRKQKSGDQLTVGDWLAPGELLDGAAEVLYVHSWPASADRSQDNYGKHVRLVVREQGSTPDYSDVVSGSTLFHLASDEDLAAYREAGRRTEYISDLRRFADWLEANPWAPLPNHFEASRHLDERHIDGPSVAESYAIVREAAARLGEQPEVRLDDRTVVRKGFGRVDYSVIAWHPDGRPAEPDADPTGLTYSREADDPTPVSPGRVPLHTGAMTEGGLVDETEAVELCPKCSQPIPAEHLADHLQIGHEPVGEAR